MSDVKPALTAEGWERRNENVKSVGPGLVSVRSQGEMKGEWSMPWSAAGLAALCLHGQPFGFTREDVEGLRRASEALSDEIGTSFGMVEGDDWFDRLADRIEALLPPEEDR